MDRIVITGSCPGVSPNLRAYELCKQCDRRQPGYVNDGPELPPVAIWFVDRNKAFCQNYIQSLESRIEQTNKALDELIRERLARRARASGSALPG